jgi:predicted HAD superfamily Cof-like phosphohydrolase
VVSRLLVTFPVDVDISDANLQRLDKVLGHICKEYEEAHPGRVMWPFGQGFMMKVNPLMLSDDEPIPFDESTYHVEVAEREKNEGEREFRLHHDRYPAEEMFQDIADFHRKFDLVYKGPPRELPLDLGLFRVGFMAEEIGEYCAPDDKDKSHTDIIELTKKYYRWFRHEVSLEKKLDALVDLVYVALGTAYLHGFAFDEAWRRVHEANMKKVRAKKAEDSARGSVHDVVKPSGWTPPDLSDLVKP